MASKHKLPAHWFILRHLEALWNGTHPFLLSSLVPNHEAHEDSLFPGISRAIGQAFGGKMPDIVGGAIVAFLIVMLEQITIPESDLAAVIQQLKYIYSQEPATTVGSESKTNLQSLIDHLSAVLPH